MLIILWFGFLILGVAVLLPLYSGLFDDLVRYHKRLYQDLGSPTLFMFSPKKSLKLQKFIYTCSSQKGIYPDVAQKCKLIGFLTPLYLIAVVVLFVWAVWSELYLNS